MHPTEPSTPPKASDSGAHAELVAQWRQLATTAARGRAPADLAQQLCEGLQADVLYVDRPEGSVARGRDGIWQARQPVLGGRSATAQVDELVRRGASPWLSADPALRIGAPGPTGQLREHLNRAVGNLDLTTTQITVQAGASTHAVLSTLCDIAQGSGCPSASLRATVQGDPLGALARFGGLAVPVSAAWDDLAKAVQRAADLPGVRVVAPSGVWAAQAGAEPATQIAVVLCSLLEALRALEDRGIDPSRAAASLEIGLALRGNVVLDLATVRALRSLAGRVLAACGAPGAVFLHASLPTTELASVDPYTNLLRLSAAGFAGAAGGADALTLPPHDAATAEPGEQGLRLAANLHLLLSREAMLDRVVDPTAGAYAIEHLTHELAREVWSGLQRIEGAGGLRAVLADGSLHATIARSAAARAAAVARREQVWVGVSQYADPSAALPALAAAPQADLTGAAERVEPFAPVRPAAGWEALRRRLAPSGARALLVELGPLRAHKARSDFLRDALQVAGFGVDGTGPVASAEAASAFASTGAPIACICGSDDDRERVVAPLAAQLVDAGARAVVVAGGWPADPEPWRAAGVTHAVRLGDDLLATLTSLADAAERT